MPEWTPFVYRDFWDFPRVLVVELDGAYFLLDAPFDEAIDDYSPVYNIKALKAFPDSSNWTGVGHGSTVLGIIPVEPELFDSTRRLEIRLDMIRDALRTS